MSSQLVFLLGITLGVLFFDKFNIGYLLLFLFYTLILLIPLFYFIYIIKNTTPDHFNVVKYSKEKLELKKYTLSLFGLLSLIVSGSVKFFDKTMNFNFILEMPWFKLVYIPVMIILILSIYFIFKHEDEDYEIFNNFIIINILKYKIIRIENKVGNVYHLLSRRNVKKNELIKNIKHLFGGIYYY